MFKPNLCDCSGAYILVKGNIEHKPDDSIAGFKNCAPFRTCDVVINNEHVEKAEDLDLVMPMYNLLEYSDNYQEVFISLKKMNCQIITQMFLLILPAWFINQSLLTMRQTM